MATRSSLDDKKFSPIEGIKGAGRWAKWFAYITAPFAVIGGISKTSSIGHTHDVAQNAVNADNNAISGINNYNTLNNPSGRPLSYAEIEHQTKVVDANAVTHATGGAKDVALAHQQADQNTLDALSPFKGSHDVSKDAHAKLLHDTANLDHHHAPTIWTGISEIGQTAEHIVAHHPLEALAISLAAAFASNAKKIKSNVLGRIK